MPAFIVTNAAIRIRRRVEGISFHAAGWLFLLRRFRRSLDLRLMPRRLGGEAIMPAEPYTAAHYATLIAAKRFIYGLALTSPVS